MSIDFLAVGHVTIDDVQGERRVGGAATYAAVAAKRLGLRAGIVTSAGPDFPYWDSLQGVQTRLVEAPRTTTFSNEDVNGVRRQRIGAVAATLGPEHFDGLDLAADAVVLYCPVVHEIEAPLVPLSASGICAVAPQGFYRQWSDDGGVSSRDWAEAPTALSNADIVSMSEADAVAPEAIAEDFPGRAFAITKGSAGCRVYAEGDVYDFPAAPAREVDATGAGDVFSAAFAIAFREGKDIPGAARFASAAAALSVEKPGIQGIPTAPEVEARL